MLARQPLPWSSPQGALARDLINAWVPSLGRVATPNGEDPTNPLAVGNATASSALSRWGVGAAKTAGGFTNLWTASGAATWSTAFGLFRYTGAGSASGLFGNTSGAAIYVTAAGKLALYVSSGTRVTCNTTINSGDYITVGYRNDPTAGYELYLNGARDDAGGVSGWGAIAAINAIGTAGTGFPGAFECFGLWSWGRYLTPAEHDVLADDPFRMYRRRSNPVLGVSGGAPDPFPLPQRPLLMGDAMNSLLRM